VSPDRPARVFVGVASTASAACLTLLASVADDRAPSGDLPQSYAKPGQGAFPLPPSRRQVVGFSTTNTRNGHSGTPI